jgi:hypothetical protein
MIDDNDFIESYTLADGSRLTICTKAGNQLAVIHQYRPYGVELQRWPDSDHAFNREDWEAFLVALALGTDPALCDVCGRCAILLCGCPR